MSTKRRLGLLPEVLPAPQTMPHTTTGSASSVRSRTMARLKVLAALGAVGIAAACGGKTTEDEDGIGGGKTGLPPDGGPGQEDAYGVVDPLPPPACFPWYEPPTATARYIADMNGDGGVEAGAFDAGSFDGGNGARIVEVLFSWTLQDVVLGSTQSKDGVTVLESETTNDGARLVLGVALEVPATIDLYQQISCSSGPSRLDIVLNLQADAVVVGVEEAQY